MCSPSFPPTIIFFKIFRIFPRRRCAGSIDGGPDISRVSGGGDSSATWGAGCWTVLPPKVGWCYGRIWRVYMFQWFLFGDECPCVVLKTKTWVKMISDFWSVCIYWWYWMHVMIKLSLEWCNYCLESIVYGFDFIDGQIGCGAIIQFI